MKTYKESLFIMKSVKYPFANKKLDNILIISFSILLTLIMFYYPLTSAGFMDIDDHEIIKFNNTFKELTSEGKSFLSAYFSILEQTEIGNFGNFGRFRPLYYALRVLESVITENPFIWFFLQSILFFLAIYLFSLALSKFFSIAYIFPIIAVTAFLPYSKDMWGRLGPSEIGCYLYFMIILFSLTKIDSKKWAWPLICISSAICMMYKENMILLWIPLFFIYVYYRNLSKINLIWTIFPSICSVFLFILFYKILTGSISHIYAYETTENRLSTVLIQWFSSVQGIVVYIFVIVYVALCRFMKISFQNLRGYNYFILTNVLLIVLNYVFYNGSINFYSGIRYAFPYSFHYLLIALAELHLMTKVHIKKYSKFCFCSFCTLFLLIALVGGFFLQLSNRSHFSYIRNFNEIINSVKNSEEIVVFNFDSPLCSYEPYYSLKEFSKSKEYFDDNPHILYYPLFYYKSEDSLNKKLELDLKKESDKLQIDLTHDRLSVVCRNPIFNNQWKILDFRSSSRFIDDIPKIKSSNQDGDNVIELFLLYDKKINSVSLFSKKNAPITYLIEQSKVLQNKDEAYNSSVKVTADRSYEENGVIILKVLFPKDVDYSLEKVEIK